MKLLAFVDVHANTSALKRIEEQAKRHNPDLLVCCGDISIFEQNIDRIIEKLGAIKKPLLLIHGNHESENIVKKLCERYDNIFFLHKKTKEIGNFVFIGYGGGGFSQIDKGFEKFSKTIEKKIIGKKTVLLTHGPPYKTALDVVYDEHVGCMSYTKFIKANQNIVLSVSGHIHDTAGRKDKIGKTTIINPGPKGMIISI